MIPPLGDDPTGDYLRKSVAVLGRGLAWLLFFGPMRAMSKLYELTEGRGATMSEIDFYWRCGVCDCKYLASEGVVKVEPYPSCPNCGEEQDVFRADDGSWPDGSGPGVMWTGVKQPRRSRPQATAWWESLDY